MDNQTFHRNLAFRKTKIPRRHWTLKKIVDVWDFFFPLVVGRQRGGVPGSGRGRFLFDNRGGVSEEVKVGGDGGQEGVVGVGA